MAKIDVEYINSLDAWDNDTLLALIICLANEINKLQDKIEEIK